MKEDLLKAVIPEEGVAKVDGLPLTWDSLEATMAKMLGSLKIAKMDTPRNQIRNHVRDLILMGTLAPSDPLPTTRKLADTWKTHISTVHWALSDLVREGLLIRRRGHGTFVAETIGALRAVGIYCDADVLLAPWHMFGREVVSSIRDQLEARGIETYIYVDSRNKDKQHELSEQLKRAAEKREIQALIPLVPERWTLSWLKRFPVPLAHIGSIPIEEPNTVLSDFAQLANGSVSQLAAQGCRSVGFVGGGSREIGPAPGFYEEFAKAARLQGLKFKPEWIRVEGGQPNIPHGGISSGHRIITEFLKEKERPDGLLIFPDKIAEDAMAALAAAGVRVPDEMKLVVHRNEKTRYPCPFPVIYAVTQERAFAEALIKQLETQLSGGTCRPIRVPFQFVPSAELDRPPA